MLAQVGRWGPQKVKGVKHFCNTFLVHRLTESDEIWRG